MDVLKEIESRLESYSCIKYEQDSIVTASKELSGKEEASYKDQCSNEFQDLCSILSRTEKHTELCFKLFFLACAKQNEGMASHLVNVGKSVFVSGMSMNK